ncbi:hypothetical protein WA588_000687 [Blastocystis sp. NMH]
MSVQLSAKIQQGGDSNRSDLLKLHDNQTELKVLESIIRHTLCLFNAAKVSMNRFQSNPTVVALYKQYIHSKECNSSTKSQIDSYTDRAVVTVSPKKVAEECVPIYESNFIIYLKNLGASGESSVLVNDVVKSVERYTVLLMKLEKEQLRLLDLTKSIISCTKSS